MSEKIKYNNPKLKPVLSLTDLKKSDPCLDYCNALYLGICSSLSLRLQLVQNAAARLLINTRKRDHIPPVLASLWLPVKQQIEFKELMYVFKALHSLAPVYISELINTYCFSKSLRSNNQLLLDIPWTRSKCKVDQAFAVVAPRLWNGLPLSLRPSTSMYMFKLHLKTDLFSIAYTEQ